MSVPLFEALEIGRTLLDENLWMPTVTIDVSQWAEVADLAPTFMSIGNGIDNLKDEKVKSRYKRAKLIAKTANVTARTTAGASKRFASSIATG